MTDHEPQHLDPGPSRTERYLLAELDQAEAEDRNISDTAARLLAMNYHSGQNSALYSIGSCGAVLDHDRLQQEIWADYNAQDATEETRRQLDHLSIYASSHEGRDRVEGWCELTTDRRIERLLGEIGLM